MFCSFLHKLMELFSFRDLVKPIWRIRAYQTLKAVSNVFATEEIEGKALCAVRPAQHKTSSTKNGCTY